MQQEPTTFEALMAEGMQASQAGEGAKAIACFERASAAAPEAGLPQFLLGAECAALGRMDEAEAAFANAVRLLPDFPIARYQLGLLQFSSGRAAMAMLTWQPLLALPESDPLRHFVSGFAELAHDHFDDALRCFRDGLALNHDNDALSGDIRKVVDGILALRASPGEDDAQTRAQALLDNYRFPDRLH